MMLGRRGLGLTGLALLAVLVGAAPARPAQAEDLLVFAAASLKNALDEVDTAFTGQTGHLVKTSLAGSSALAKQLEQGAPADVFISADLDWMDYIQKAGLLADGSRFDLLRNSIVLVAGKDSTIPAQTIGQGFDLARLLGDQRLAMALVESVPAGKYGKAALESLGSWNAVAGKVAEAENVRAALLLVSRGEAPLGIVYRTDAAAEPAVRILGAFPASSHPAIIYPAAVLKASAKPAAIAYLNFLRGPAARAAFERQGFAVIASPAS